MIYSVVGRCGAGWFGEIELSSAGHEEGGGAERNIRDAIRKARTVQADRSDVIVELQAAEAARLELLADELESVFAELSSVGGQFECNLVPGNPPRLWIDMISYVSMAADKRTYRFVCDSRAGRKVLIESSAIADVADFITDYVAHRVIERERALDPENEYGESPVNRGYGGLTLGLAFVAGVCVGVIAVFMLALALTAS